MQFQLYNNLEKATQEVGTGGMDGIKGIQRVFRVETHPCVVPVDTCHYTFIQIYEMYKRVLM